MHLQILPNLISSPEFVDRHLRHSLSSNSDRLLILLHKGYGIHAVHLDSPEIPAVRLPISRSTEIDGFLFVGSCNGLLCIGVPFSSLLVLNPATGIYREVYDPYLPGCKNNYGFGYDDISCEYKIVRFTSRVSLCGNVFGNSSSRRLVEVYRLNSDSWTMIEVTSGSDFIGAWENGVLLNNHLLHWSGSNEIFCFDLRNDRWADEIPMPDLDNLERGSNECASASTRVRSAHSTDLANKYCIVEPYYFRHLSVNDGYLSLSTTNFHNDGVEVWVMKEYGVKDSWIKLVSIPLREFRPCYKILPITYAKESENELLMLNKASPSKFFWYNIGHKTWRWAETDGGVPAFSDACMCRGSLVDIPGGVRFRIEEEKDDEDRVRND